MNFLQTRVEEHVYHILLDKGKSNALDIDAVNALIEAIDYAAQDPAIEGLILSGNEGFFSAGLDLITLYEYDNEQMVLFWKRFMTLLQKFIAFPKPTVSAITGHSPAGGCVLALCCDYRVMAEGEYIIGLNEVSIGIVVPQCIFQLYAFWLGSGPAYRNLLQGRLFTPSEALSAGLVDEVVSLGRIQTVALRQIKSMMQFEKNAWQNSKQNFRKDLLAYLAQDHDEAIRQVLEQWWRPSTRSILKTIIENLTQRK